MGNKCSICQHINKLDMEKQYLQGIPMSSISKKYGVQYNALLNHCHEHISRRLATNFNKQQLQQSFDLIGEIDSIISNVKDIFKRNYEKGKDETALRAISEHRNTLELLAKISAYLHESDKGGREQQEFEQEQSRQKEYRLSLAVFSRAELKMYCQLVEKRMNQTTELIIPDSPGDCHAAEQDKLEIIYDLLSNKTSPTLAKFEIVHDIETDKFFRLPLRRTKDGEAYPRDRTGECPGDYDPVTDAERKAAGIKRTRAKPIPDVQDDEESSFKAAPVSRNKKKQPFIRTKEPAGKKNSNQDTIKPLPSHTIPGSEGMTIPDRSVSERDRRRTRYDFSPGRPIEEQGGGASILFSHPEPDADPFEREYLDE